MEQEIRQAIDPTPQLQPEPPPKLEPKPKVTIYDFSRLLSANEPPKK
jgi:hypothetical protein